MHPKLTTVLSFIITCLLSVNLFADQPFSTLLPALTNAKGETVSPKKLQGKTVALYFSAQECAACRAFTPTLVRFHKRNRGKNFEIVLVSYDSTKEEKAGFISKTGLEFLTVAGSKTEMHVALAKRFGVGMLPRLIVLAPDGSVVSKHGDSDVNISPKGALAKWQKSARS